MGQPIRGYDGTVTLAGLATAFVTDWQVQLDTQEQTEGPFIGDNGVLYTYTTSRKLSGTLNATVPIGKDAGQTAMLSGALNSSLVSIVLVSTGGYTVTIPSGSVSKFTLKEEAKGTVTLSFDFSSSGSFTVA